MCKAYNVYMTNGEVYVSFPDSFQELRQSVSMTPTRELNPDETITRLAMDSITLPRKTTLEEWVDGGYGLARRSPQFIRDLSYKPDVAEIRERRKFIATQYNQELEGWLNNKIAEYNNYANHAGQYDYTQLRAMTGTNIKEPNPPPEYNAQQMNDNLAQAEFYKLQLTDLFPDLQ